MKKIFLWTLCAVLISSCAMHPLGISDETWQKMTPEQQANAYEKQANIDAKERAQQLAHKQKQEQEIAAIKANPRYGEYIQCVLNNAKYKEFGSWLSMESLNIDAIKDKTTETTATYYRNNDHFFKTTKKLYVSMTGTRIKVCDGKDSFSNCSIINSTMPQYQKGRHIKINSGVIKGTAQCDMVYDSNNHHSNNGSSDIIINI